MGKRLELSQLLKNSVAFAAASSITIDAGILLLDRLSDQNLPNSWYINGPLAAWILVGIPTSLTLAGRMLSQVDSSAGRILSYQEGGSPAVRGIPFSANGRQGTIFANTAKAIFGSALPAEDEGPAYHPAVWKVPVPPHDAPVVVRESELRAFLELAYKRQKHQFSRRYWTQHRRPPLWTGKYSAFMRLLVESGLIEGRHEQGGASGRLVSFPREAVMFLKYESCFKVA